MSNPSLTLSANCPNVSEDISKQVIFTKGEIDMGDKGKKDKGKREQQKQSQHSTKEKRKIKKEKKPK